MEQVSLEQVNENLEALKQAVQAIQMKLDFLIENDNLIEIEPVNMDELSDEVIKDIEESKKKPESSFISQEDIEAEFGL